MSRGDSTDFDAEVHAPDRRTHRRRLVQRRRAASSPSRRSPSQIPRGVRDGGPLLPRPVLSSSERHSRRGGRVLQLDASAFRQTAAVLRSTVARSIYIYPNNYNPSMRTFAARDDFIHAAYNSTAFMLKLLPAYRASFSRAESDTAFVRETSSTTAITRSRGELWGFSST